MDSVVVRGPHRWGTPARTPPHPPGPRWRSCSGSPPYGRTGDRTRPRCPRSGRTGRRASARPLGAQGAQSGACPGRRPGNRHGHLGQGLRRWVPGELLRGSARRTGARAVRAGRPGPQARGHRAPPCSPPSPSFPHPRPAVGRRRPGGGGAGLRPARVGAGGPPQPHPVRRPEGHVGAGDPDGTGPHGLPQHGVAPAPRRTHHGPGIGPVRPAHHVGRQVPALPRRFGHGRVPPGAARPGLGHLARRSWTPRCAGIRRDGSEGAAREPAVTFAW